MREWLLHLLGTPRPIVIEIDRAAITHARPGDVLVLTSHRSWPPSSMRAFCDELASRLAREAPGVAVFVHSPDWQAVVVPAVSRPTSEGQ